MSLPKPPLRKLEQAFGYTFNNKQRLQQALTHRSADSQHNERLEFLGDSILGFIVAEALFEQFPEVPEGDLSRMRATLVCGKALAKLAKSFSLGDYLILGPGEMKSGGNRRESILADTLEAMLGAMYLEANMATCTEVVRGWYAQTLTTIKPGQGQKDPKTRLQEYLQGRQMPVPEYEVIAAEGQAHNQQFTVSCRTEIFPEPELATGTSRRKAEQQAALQLLQKIKESYGHDA
ncbi:RNAse III [Pseudidiomarina planktonica]|uniref:Ribonuclease 3 n=1 Tax=Pseudidiomarina planktonica TaxID=1323738 RepID=A0A1Y6EWL3_9GAMM|nr:ribonuclease III [Pseudidiomarina planktonica]RUO65522.1 ribonuclease III [Pseudidiomarina planktonica]SMQ64643.1 RNAse III [Pseudidiomarina planktonica]